jgi:hypothetical protein
VTARRRQSLEERLTEGYAEAHLLERRVLQLDRRTTVLLEGGASGEVVRAVVTERRRVRLELAALRRRLKQLRATAE